MLLTIAGDQVPVMPLLDVVGKTGAVEPLQIGATASKAGITFGVITIINVLVVAHCPAVGVKVYVPVVVLLTVAGDQVPVIPLVDVVGNTGAVAPLHIGSTAAKSGTVPAAVTVTVKVACVAHCPIDAVKV